MFLLVTQFSSNLQSSELTITAIPADFVHDGCSLFPDWNYGHCCKIHDDAYFFGGSWQERIKSDAQLSHCVQELWGFHTILWPVMFAWVRVWGAPTFPTSYRWGFGRDLY